MSEKHFTNSRLRALAAKAAAFLFVIAAGTPANADTRVGWVWANQPNATSCYTPETNYSYNSQGGTITVCPFDSGYQVQFGGLYGAQPDDIQVSAYDTSGYCVLSGWGQADDVVVADLFCYDAAGRLAPSSFTLLYQSRAAGFGSSNKGIAFLLADQPSTASYTPSLSYQYNSTGETNTIVRNGTGNYVATIPGLSAIYSDVQVTPLVSGTTTEARCNAVGWRAGGDGTQIEIQCFDYLGNPVDDIFDLAYTVKTPLGLVSPPHTKGAFAWADQDTNASVYTPQRLYQANSFRTGHLKAQKLSTGEYAVYIPGSLSYDSSNVLVTGYNSGNTYCNVNSWSISTIVVNCWSQGGTAADSQFDVVFQTHE